MNIRKKQLRNLLVLTLVFIMSFSSIPVTRANAASYFTGNKWNKSVVSIYVDDTPSSAQAGITIPSIYYVYWRSSIIEAIGRWSMYLNSWNADIRISLANSASSADVVIKYGTRSTSWAQTFPTASNGVFQKVEIEIRDWSFYQYNFDPLTQTDIVTHELGHALGLADISEAAAASAGISSIMVNSVYPPSAHFSGYPTNFDKTNIFTLY